MALCMIFERLSMDVEYYNSGIAEAMDAVPGIRVALEPKPYEPAINNIFRTTAEGI